MPSRGHAKSRSRAEAACAHIGVADGEAQARLPARKARAFVKRRLLRESEIGAFSEKACPGF
jgi:plasmid stabilization system protein ParE